MNIVSGGIGGKRVYPVCLIVSEYKVNAAEGVNATSEEVSTAELVSTAYGENSQWGWHLQGAISFKLHSYLLELDGIYLSWIRLVSIFTKNDFSIGDALSKGRAEGVDKAGVDVVEDDSGVTIRCPRCLMQLEFTAEIDEGSGSGCWRGGDDKWEGMKDVGLEFGSFFLENACSAGCCGAAFIWEPTTCRRGKSDMSSGKLLP
ncbi:hypothetical protein Tco_1292680 [Tanacetum coccineum]